MSAFGDKADIELSSLAPGPAFKARGERSETLGEKCCIVQCQTVFESACGAVRSARLMRGGASSGGAAMIALKSDYICGEIGGSDRD